MNIKSIIPNKLKKLLRSKYEDTSFKSQSINLKEKMVKIIDENNNELEVKQFNQRISEPNLALIQLTDYESHIYHSWLDCYEDWSSEYVKDFCGWKVKKLDSLKHYSECKRCAERDYRNSHPNTIITGYDFHYYFEDINN